MNWWWKRPAAIVRAPSSTSPADVPEASGDAGQYQALYVYLLNIQDVYGASERLVWEPRVDGKLLANTMAVQ